MKPTRNGVMWSALALTVAGILSFGASRAYAGAATLRACPGSSIGTCVNTEDCQNQCTVAYPGSTGICSEPSFCCFCLQ